MAQRAGPLVLDSGAAAASRVDGLVSRLNA